MKFPGCQGGAEAPIEVFAPGPEVRQALELLGTFSPRLDRDLADLCPRDAGEPEQAGALRVGVRRAALVKGHGLVTPEQLGRAAPQAKVLIFAATLWSAVEIWGEALGASCVFALGGRAYTRSLRDCLRGSQRLLPLAEVDLVTAARTAVLESGDVPLWVIVDLHVLAPHLLPGEPPPAPGGASLQALREALEVVPGERVMGFEVTGYPTVLERNPLTALTGAELLRDNMLTWWCC